MPVALFVVRATISSEKEAEWNRWYDEEHVPQLLEYHGAVSARRYRSLSSDESFQYMAVYEFRDEDTLRRFLSSDHLKALVADYDAKFGASSERKRESWIQIFP